MPGETKPKVFVTRQFPVAGLDPILDACDAEVWHNPLPPPRDVLLGKISGCDGVLAMLTESVDNEFMETAGKQLKVISNFAVGFNNIDVD